MNQYNENLNEYIENVINRGHSLDLCILIDENEFGIAIENFILNNKSENLNIWLIICNFISKKARIFQKNEKNLVDENVLSKVIYHQFDWNNEIKMIVDFTEIFIFDQFYLKKLENNYAIKYVRKSRSEASNLISSINCLKLEILDLNSLKFLSGFKTGIIKNYTLALDKLEPDNYLKANINIESLNESFRIFVDDKQQFQGKEVYVFVVENIKKRKLILKYPKYLDINLESKIKTQLIADDLAEKFNKIIINKKVRIEFTIPSLINIDKEDFLIEKYIEGQYRKFNSNKFLISLRSNNQDSILDEFSLWTFEYTQGRLMVVDLQGVRTEGLNGEILYELTDPAINSINGMFGKTDIGINGLKSCIFSNILINTKIEEEKNENDSLKSCTSSEVTSKQDFKNQKTKRELNQNIFANRFQDSLSFLKNFNFQDKNLNEIQFTDIITKNVYKTKPILGFMEYISILNKEYTNSKRNINSTKPNQIIKFAFLSFLNYSLENENCDKLKKIYFIENKSLPFGLSIGYKNSSFLKKIIAKKLSDNTNLYNFKLINNYCINFLTDLFFKNINQNINAYLSKQMKFKDLCLNTILSAKDFDDTKFILEIIKNKNF